MAVLGTEQYDVFKPVVIGWLSKIERAERDKRAWQEIADQCTAFFSAATGFMWDPKFRNKYMNGTVTPRFKMTMAKAFELVAIFGPSLYWNNPQRKVAPRKQFEFDEIAIQSLQDPMLAELFQQAQAMQEADRPVQEMRCQLLERYLNYTPGEQPGGGLATQSSLGIVEALVKGRGLLWVGPYRLPGSQRTLTGSFWDTVNNLYVDPDCLDPTLRDAKWICQKCIEPIWKVQADRPWLKKGALANAGTMESAQAQGESKGDDLSRMHRQQGQTFDLMVYYKVWSKGGAGQRMTGVNTVMKDYMDETLGDYCYLEVAKNVPYPLNCPPEITQQGTTEDVQRAMAWPIPFWKDDRWPVAVLDFYPRPNSAWPIAPLAPGLGELAFINTMVSQLCNRIYTSSRDFIFVLKSAEGYIKEKLLQGEDLTVIGLEEIHADIRKVVQVLQMPQTNLDVWKIIEAMTEIFEKRTGLSDEAYGRNSGGVPRSAEDARNRYKAAGVRPDYMAACVEEWQTEVARMEKVTATLAVGPEDIAPQFGPAGSYLWQKLIVEEDPEVVLFQTDCTIEAGSVRKPNKDRDVANVNEMLPQLLPQLTAYAQATGDTDPINAMVRQWGDAIDQDVSGIQLGQWTPEQPQQDPNQIAQQQHEMEMQQREHEQAVEQNQQQHEMQMAQAQATLQQTQVDAQVQQQNAQTQQAQMEGDLMAKREQMKLDALGQILKLQQQHEAHAQKLDQNDQAHQQKLVQQKQAAKAKPKPAAKPKKSA